MQWGVIGAPPAPARGCTSCISGPYDSGRGGRGVCAQPSAAPRHRRLMAGSLRGRGLATRRRGRRARGWFDVGGCGTPVGIPVGPRESDSETCHGRVRGRRVSPEYESVRRFQTPPPARGGSPGSSGEPARGRAGGFSLSGDPRASHGTCTYPALPAGSLLYEHGFVANVRGAHFRPLGRRADLLRSPAERCWLLSVVCPVVPVQCCHLLCDTLFSPPLLRSVYNASLRLGKGSTCSLGRGNLDTPVPSKEFHPRDMSQPKGNGGKPLPLCQSHASQSGPRSPLKSLENDAQFLLSAVTDVFAP